jgi:hypothetical protein
MKPRRSLIKLLFGSIIAGIIVKYAAPAGVDPVPLLWLIILLLIALVPFMFALFSGIWGFFTYLSGFLSGYLMVSGYFSSDLIVLGVGIFCLILGIMSALYGEFIKA